MSPHNIRCSCFSSYSIPLSRLHFLPTFTVGVLVSATRYRINLSPLSAPFSVQDKRSSVRQFNTLLFQPKYTAADYTRLFLYLQTQVSPLSTSDIGYLQYKGHTG